MPRPKGPPTKVERLTLSQARKLRALAKHWDVTFRDAFDRISGRRIDDLYRRMKAGEHIGLGESGA